MDKFFDSMDFIEIGTACQWLCQLTDSPFPLQNREFMELCERYLTPVYIDCSALEGVIATRAGSRFVMQQVIGIELCRVDSPACAYTAFEPHKSGGIDVTGMAVTVLNGADVERSHVNSWILTNPEGRPFLFRPSDIKKMASFLKPPLEEHAAKNQDTPEQIMAAADSAQEKSERSDALPRKLKSQEEQAANDQARTEEITSPRGPIIDDRLKMIRRWFQEQTTYNADQLSKRCKGVPGARDACWQWLVQSKLTNPRGALFFGASPKHSGKSKKFINAWSIFLKENTPLDPKIRSSDQKK